ncbi:hypothetical protein VHUM_02363 [Vanrija humicola]|uniref:4-aminobutyrate aminotransferase n=1 Tax=Vanrija humicola TaxID=5417 RepID=A0A7D8YWZ6_VANHU|nr:hypothetical protein VHUM_02363 [Vanrija humicola]
MPIPVRTNAEWEQFGRDHTCRGLGRLYDEVVVKGNGLTLTTADGKEYLDFTAGIGVTNLGHSHPAVTAAAQEQVGNIVHMQCSIFQNPAYLQLIDRLLPVLPDKSLDAIYFWNSGTEAVEAAIKLARASTGRHAIVTFQGAYHGRTAGSASLTRSKPVYSKKTGPHMPGVFVAPYPYWHSLGLPPSTPEDVLVDAAIHQLDLVFRQQVAPLDVGAIFIEPVQGEGGYIPCPPRFLHHLRSLCDQHGILLVLDEVQTGFYRTGSYFAISDLGLRPDIMTFAKGVANGFPLSGIASSKALMDKFEPGTMGGTYAGNPVACAAGVAVQDVLATGEVKANVAARSEQIFNALRALQASPKTGHLIADVRGKGLMVAVEFRSNTDKLTHEGLAPGTALPQKIGPRVQTKCKEKGVIILTTSCFDTIRFIPALIVSEEEMSRAMNVFGEALNEVALEG